MDKISLDILSVLRIDSAQKFSCHSCGNLVNPDHAQQALCGELLCGNCALCMTNCNAHSSHPFKKYIIDSSCKKEIGEVMVRCEWQIRGCRWIGTLSDFAIHKVSCQWKWRLDEPRHEGQSAEDLTMSTKVMAEKYENAYFLWSWRGEKVNGEPVLSEIRKQGRGMCAFVSITAAFEASLRLKGHKVKALSIEQLRLDYCEAKKGQNASNRGKLHILAMILKEKGMLELSSDGEPLKRWYCSDFKMFTTKTKDGILEVTNHIHDHGPVVCVHAVTEYQSDNLTSWGIFHGTPSNFDVHEYVQLHNISFNNLPTHAVCAVGFGSEDRTSFLSYQNTAGKDIQKDGYGRILPCSVLEALGLFVGEDCVRPLKRSNVMISQQHQKRHKDV